MASVRLEKLRKSFGRTEVIRDIDLEIADGEFVVFVGPSGCGKSTLLRLIAGLEDASGGDIWIGEDKVTATEPAKRGVSMVFQSYALYPHMTVRKNIAFGLSLSGAAKETVHERVGRVAGMLQIGELLDRRPRELSGGQRQRVAIARAIVREPRVFLFDEPLSNLDAALRVQTRVEIAKMHQDLGATMIYVTHDQVEAMTLADRMVVLNGGRVEQAGKPADLYHKPDNLFVAGFLGSPPMNLLPVKAGAAGLDLPGLRKAETLGVRSEDISLNADGPLEAKVTLVEELGETRLVHATLDDGGKGDSVGLAFRHREDPPPKRGDKVRLALDPARCHLFDKEGKRL
ncbi:ABC transporter ATP-binding protein [Oceanibaculum indicum]|uniref:Multiple sugar transport system ATP-binding protein/multiple sugar transport system ATP-binding protein n=1 Tax=Oceanibaculum indicum TaxID=526216 RepID=A0A420WPD8_9PROT|nr:ABC transporter ATP-binding protein [Oceanibaculum indicum]RKQ72908.1 multiple sugar transport system ATP-binding protein/multiple sugar transport system ATP-binding protein [Oceanibaculum indicum]